MKLINAIYEHAPVFLQNCFISLYGLKIKNIRYSRKFEEEYEMVKKQKDTNDKSDSYQFGKLKELLYHAYKTIPYYRDLFTRLGINIDEINNFDDFKVIPMIDKETVIENIENLISTKYKKRDLIPAKTGGTTGTSLKFFYDKSMFAKEYAYVYTYSRIGFNPNDKNASFNGRFIVPRNQQKPPFWRKNCFLNQTLYSAYHITEKNLKYYVEDIKKNNYKFITGYPSQIYLVADYILRNRHTIDNGPKRIFTSSETLHEYQRKTIETAFNCKISDLYGQGEKVSMAYQCDEGHYHFIHEYGYNELINIYEDDSTITGELVATGFINYATPFIRYKTGDYITIYKDIRCKCGEKGPVIKSIDGRIEDIIVLKNGRKIGRLNNFIFLDQPNIKEAQIVQNNYEELDFYLVTRLNYCKNDEDKLLKTIKSYIGDDMGINLFYPKEISREKNGKFRAIISNLKTLQKG